MDIDRCHLANSEDAGKRSLWNQASLIVKSNTLCSDIRTAFVALYDRSKYFCTKTNKGFTWRQEGFLSSGDAFSPGIGWWWCPFSTGSKTNWWLAWERFCYEWTLSVARNRRLTKGKWTSLLSIIASRCYLDGSAELNTKKLPLSSFSLYGQNFLGRVKRIPSFLVHQQNKHQCGVFIINAGMRSIQLNWQSSSGICFSSSKENHP